MDRTTLLEAVERGDGEAARQALDAGISPDSSDRLGVPVLMRAAGQGDLEMVELLLAYGAEVDRTSDQGNTALMLACARGHPAVVDRLLAAGADPGQRNRWDFGAQDWGRWPANSAEILARL